MRRKKIPEGTWFAVPLEHGGYALGLVARTSGDGIMLGYFYCGRWTAPPTLDVAAGLQPERAACVYRFGDLELMRGKWPVLGVLDGWDRSKWTIPEFVRRGLGGAWIVRYSDDDPSVRVSETRCSGDVALEVNGLYGAGAVEMDLTKRCQEMPKK